MYAILPPSGEIATSTGTPSIGCDTESISAGGSSSLITSPFWRSRTIRVPLDTAIVPSSACDGDRYGDSYDPSVVTCVSFEPSGATSHTL